MGEPGLKTHARCPLCESSRLVARYHDIPDRLGTSGGRYTLDECANCGLGLINPAPTGDMSRFYPSSYLSQEEDAQGGLLSRLERLYRFDQYKFDIALLCQVLDCQPHDIPSIVDIGCGSGERVEYVAARGCERSVGIDRYAFGKSTARRDVELISTEIADFQPRERFAVAFMFHVLEHVEDPLGVLVHVREEILDKHGLLVVQVPNYGSLERRIFGRRWFGLDAPRHLFQFGRATARSLLLKAGYEVLAVYAKNAPLHPVTLVPSVLPALDVQRIWISDKSRATKLLMQALWVVGSLAVVPLALLQNLRQDGSMLTVIARPAS